MKLVDLKIARDVLRRRELIHGKGLPCTHAPAGQCASIPLPSQRLPYPLRRNQLHRLPGLYQHLEEHLGLGLEQGDPMLQIGGMALQLTADLEPIAKEHRSQLGDQLLPGIAGLAKGPAEIALESGGMAGGVDLLMGPGGIKGPR